MGGGREGEVRGRAPVDGGGPRKIESCGFGPAPPLDLVGAASSLGYGRVGKEEGSSFGRACA
jgi:hypothetical protein